MAEVTVLEAARCLGISSDTVRRRISTGELLARKEAHGTNWVWWVEVPDELLASVADTPGPEGDDHPTEPMASDAGAVLEAQVQLIDSLKAQVQAQGEELEARRREVQELHVLLQQAQKALPAPAPPRPGLLKRLWRKVV